MKIDFLQQKVILSQNKTGINVFLMERYTVYLLINTSVQEVFFGYTIDLNKPCSIPEEITHWDFRNHNISNPVMMEEDLLLEEAVTLIADLQEKTLRNPQGKTLVPNIKTIC